MDYMQGNSSVVSSDGLSGLGVINTNNSSATIDNTVQSNFIEDEKLLSTNSSKFVTEADWFNYLYDYMCKSPVLQTRAIDDSIKQSIGFSFIFYTEFNTVQGNTDGNSGFCIFSCPKLENVQSILNLLSNSTNTNLPGRKVAIGYFNCDNNTKNMAKQAGLELMGYDSILDLNNAINNGLNKMPYISATSNSFETMLAKRLNDYYKQNSTASITQNLGGEMRGIGAGLGAAFSEGFGQLKDSIMGFGKQLGFKGNQQPQQQMQPQQPVQFEQNTVNQTVPQQGQVEQAPLGESNENINLDMSVNSPKVTLDKQEHNLEMNTTKPLDLQAHHIPPVDNNNTTTGVSLGKN